MDVRGTPASESDLPRAKHLLKGAKERRPESRIASTSMHCAYDSYENHRFAVERVRPAPIVTLNPSGTVDAITDGSLYLTDDGLILALPAVRAFTRVTMRSMAASTSIARQL